MPALPGVSIDIKETKYRILNTTLENAKYLAKAGQKIFKGQIKAANLVWSCMRILNQNCRRCHAKTVYRRSLIER